MKQILLKSYCRLYLDDTLHNETFLYKMDIINFDDNQHRSKNQKHHFLIPDCHFMLIGATGCGKTNLLLNMLLKYMNFDTCTIYTINEGQKKWVHPAIPTPAIPTPAIPKTVVPTSVVPTAVVRRSRIRGFGSGQTKYNRAGSDGISSDRP